MARIEGEIVICQPAEEIFDVVADNRNEPYYNPTMYRVEKITDGPIELGTQFRAVTLSRGQRFEMITEITGFDRPRQLRLVSHLKAMVIQGTLTFEAVPNGTLMHWIWDVEPRGVYRMMGPIFAQIGSRQEERVWVGLKQFMEGDKPSPPAPPTRIDRGHLTAH